MTFVRDRLPEPRSRVEGLGATPRGNGKNMRFRCLFDCGDGDTMSMHAQSGAFYCFRCGAKGGDLVALEMGLKGCSFVEACKSLGAWQDDPKDATQPRRRPLSFPARDALEILAEESNLVAVAAGNVAHGVPMTAADKERLMQAAGRIRVIAREVAA